MWRVPHRGCVVGWGMCVTKLPWCLRWCGLLHGMYRKTTAQEQRRVFFRRWKQFWPSLNSDFLVFQRVLSPRPKSSLGSTLNLSNLHMCSLGLKMHETLPRTKYFRQMLKIPFTRKHIACLLKCWQSDMTKLIFSFSNLRLRLNLCCTINKN